MHDLFPVRPGTPNPWDCIPHDELYGFHTFPEVGVPVSPADCHQLALIVALRGTGNVSPNPLVGAVAVDAEHRFLGAAGHLRVGDSHAEALLLKNIANAGLSPRLQGGKIYVTLEPCAHHGRTPPCADALAKFPLAEVIYGAHDPDPRVNGAGAERIRAAGIKVTFAAAWQDNCNELAEFFLRTVGDGLADDKRERLFVGLKVASTTDGLVARRGDQRAWITGERARAHGHFLRLRYDAILIGPGTFLADNPSLTVRQLPGGRTPLRVVLDPRGTAVTAEGVSASNLLKQEPGRTMFIVSQNTRVPQTVLDSGAKVVRLPDSSHFPWQEILGKLKSAGVQSLLIEGGAGVYKSALPAGVVDKIHWYRSPDHSGLGEGDPSALRWVETPSELRELHVRRRIPLGRDTLIEGYWRP